MKWISVKDKLPEHTPDRAVYVIATMVDKKGKNPIVASVVSAHGNFYIPEEWAMFKTYAGTIDCVSHWQYLPKPPKQ